MLKKLLRLIIIAGITILIFGFVLIPVQIVGQSMEPTYRDGSFILINRLTYLARRPARGDIAAIKIAGRKLMFLKRIIGLPGETIMIKNGQVQINDELIAEPYLLNAENWNYPATILAADEYFVIGDNRRQPVEEHVFGRVPRARIVGAPLW